MLSQAFVRLVETEGSNRLACWNGHAEINYKKKKS